MNKLLCTALIHSFVDAAPSQTCSVMLCVHFLTHSFKQQISGKAPRRWPFLGQLQLSRLHARFLNVCSRFCCSPGYLTCASPFISPLNTSACRSRPHQSPVFTGTQDFMCHMFNLPLRRVAPRLAKVIGLKVQHSLDRCFGIVFSGLVDSSLFADAGLLQKAVTAASVGLPV